MTSAWLALVLLDAVAIAAFARCFTGPGELLVAIPVCIAVHVVAHLARWRAAKGQRLWAWLVWLAAVLVAVAAPILLVDGSWAHVGSQMQAAWHIFSYNVAPVEEAKGLVLASGWAAGVLALAAEALDADSSLPAIVTLIPAFDIVMFTGTLGTPVGRAPELAALAALAVWYLTGTRRHAHQEQVVTARLEGSGRSTAGLEPAASSWLARMSAQMGAQAPGLVAVAALAAGVIGPLAPGAQTAAVIQWHGSGNGSAANQGGRNGSGSVGPVSVSNLVKVQEVEINDANVPLFIVTEPFATRQTLVVLDGFNGNEFYPVANGSVQQVAQDSEGLLGDKVPPPIVGRDGAQVTEIVTDIALAGNEVPVPGYPVFWVAGDLSQATRRGADGPLLDGVPLAAKDQWEEETEVAPSPAVAQPFVAFSTARAPAVDTSLPKGIPANIVALAHDLVRGESSLAAKATSIQDFLKTHYTYKLATVSSGSSKPYAALEDFLFHSYKGYCQQFAGAFTVLARIDGLPTRIAIGFLPGDRETASADTYVVTGSEVHAWPQVYFPGTGWIDFEPTPGAGAPPRAPVPTTTVPTVTVPPTTLGGGSVPTTRVACRGCQPLSVKGTSPKGTSLPPGIPKSGGRVLGSGSSGGSSGSSGAGYVLLVMGLLAALWVLVVPGSRRVRWLRTKVPVAGMALAWHDSVVALAAAGFHRRRAETLVEFGDRVGAAGLLTDEANAALDRLVAATNRTHFSPRAPTADTVAAARSDSRLICESARRSVSWWLRILMSLDPRDLTDQVA
ncbi:MAG: transglutaminase domain-containing protein [Acidimicrobiales bacterium]